MAEHEHGERATAAPRIVRHAQRPDGRRVRRASGPGRQPGGSGHADFDFDNPSVPFGQIGGGQSPPQHWFERGETQRQISLLVDPPNGRLPALTAAAQQREADRRANSPAQPASYTDFSLYERCITRGLIGSVMPGGYNNGNQIFQAPGYVTIVNEMIHESRVVPLDGRPHSSPAIGSHLGDSRGRWEGDTLVVETKNIADRTAWG